MFHCCKKETCCKLTNQPTTTASFDKHAVKATVPLYNLRQQLNLYEKQIRIFKIYLSKHVVMMILFFFTIRYNGGSRDIPELGFSEFMTIDVTRNGPLSQTLRSESQNVVHCAVYLFCVCVIKQSTDNIIVCLCFRAQTITQHAVADMS